VEILKIGTLVGAAVKIHQHEATLTISVCHFVMKISAIYGKSGLQALWQ